MVCAIVWLTMTFTNREGTDPGELGNLSFLLWPCWLYEPVGHLNRNTKYAIASLSAELGEEVKTEIEIQCHMQKDGN